MKLHEITNEILMDALVDANGEISPEAEAQLGALEEDLHAKTEAYCKIIRTFECEACAAQAEVDRLQKLVQVRTNAAKRLKAWLLQNLQRLGLERVETDLFRVRIQQNGRPSINYSGDPEALPPFMRRVKVEVNGDAAYELWKGGQELPPGFQVTRGSHLRIS